MLRNLRESAASISETQSPRLYQIRQKVRDDESYVEGMEARSLIVRACCIDSTYFYDFPGPVWVKNLEQKLNLKLKSPTEDEIVKLGGKSMEK